MIATNISSLLSGLSVMLLRGKTRQFLLPGVALGVAFLLGGLAGQAQSAYGQQQEVPEAIQEELDAQNMSPEEARRRARQLGIDLSDPETAARQARQRGIPEARVQALLEAARQSGQASETGEQPQPSMRPSLAGQATVRPDTVSLSQLPQDVTVSIPLVSEGEISSVEPFFVGESRSRQSTSGANPPSSSDTLRVRNVRRTSEAKETQEWEGRVRVPSDIAAGTYPLRVRVTSGGEPSVVQTNQSLHVRSEEEEDQPTREGLAYFGYDTFNTVPDAFEPSPDGPVDDSYVVGPGDELRLVVWGAPEFQYDLTVDEQGRVYVPDHGQFTAAGKQLDALRTDMKKWLSRKHSGLEEEPQTVFMDLSVTRLRPLRVFMLGEVDRPGGYTVSATSNAFNALYSVGGPLQRGSLRRIQVMREGEVTATVDLYEYLMEDGSPEPTNLQSGDYIRVPVRGKTVAITGAVKRPAYYEMKEGETARDLIEYAGGLESEAYVSDFEISRLLPPGEREEENASVPRKDLNYDLGAVMAGETTVELSDADRVRIKEVPGRQDRASASNVESAAISGAVFQPGRYALGDSVRTVRELIGRANGLTDDAYRQQAKIIRFDEDLDEAVRSVNLDSAMAGVPRANIPLVPGDSLHISSVQNLEAERSVEISGQVRDPGTYRYRTDMTVQDLLLRGGGLADSTYLDDVLRSRADLYRESEDGRSERIIPFNLTRALNGSGMAEEPLRPGDEIRIYPLGAEVNREKFVEISGAVKDPGEYSYQENLSVKDVILKANGFEENVYLDEVEVARPQEGEDGMRTVRIPIGENLDDPEDVRYTADDTTRALQAAAEVQVRHRDRVLVRTDPEYSERDFVSIQGEIQFPGEYALNDDGEMLSSVLERAGGVLETGYPGGGQLVRDGEPFVTDIGNVVRGRNDVPLRDGDEITIPTTPNSVSVRGNVAQPGRIQFSEGRDVEYYLDRAGETRDSTKAVYLTQATGATFKVGTGWFSSSPDVTDGAVIRVTREAPPPEDQEGVDIGQTITDVTGILSSALTIIVLAGRAFN